MVRSASVTFAWHDSREVASSPQALSSMSSSFSSAGSSASNPSRTTTWQVVQAQDFSHACSMSMWFSSSVSQIETPGFASISAPSGQSVACGSTLSIGIRAGLEAADLAAAEAAPESVSDAPRRELLRGAVQRIGGILDRPMVPAGQHLLEVPRLLFD